MDRWMDGSTLLEHACNAVGFFDHGGRWIGLGGLAGAAGKRESCLGEGGDCEGVYDASCFCFFRSVSAGSGVMIESRSDRIESCGVM